MLLLKLSARNVLRHRRRTLLIGSAMAFGLSALLFGWAMFDGINAQLIGNMTANYSGHMQVQQRGYLDNGGIDLSFEPGQTAGLLDHPDIQAAAPRLSAKVLIASGTNARGVLLTGVDPVLEKTVTQLHQKISAGHYLLPEGRNQLVMGSSLARALSVEVGDEVSVIAEGWHGAVGAKRLQVGGIYDSGNAMVDAYQVFVGRTSAEDLLSAPGRLTSIAMRLRSVGDVERVRADLSGILPPDLQVHGWRHLLPSVAQSVDLHANVIRTVMWVVFLVVALGMASTLQMAVAERVREFGVMSATGVSPWQLSRCIVYEGLWIAGGAFFVAAMLDASVVAAIGGQGIDFSAHNEAMRTMEGSTSFVHPSIDVSRFLEVGAGFFLVVLVATALPALRVAGLQPVAAMRARWRAASKPAAGPRLRLLNERLPLGMRLALRNLGRSPLRTGLGLGVLALGLASFIFVSAFAEGYLVQMTRNATGLLSGDAQVQHQEFRFDSRPQLAFADDAPWLARLDAAPGVLATSPRIQAHATLGSARGAEPVTLVGADPVRERAVTHVDKAIVEGAPLARPGDVLIGQKLARRLDVRVGEKLVATTQDTSGALASEAFRVSGIFSTGSHGPDVGMAIVHLGAAQSLLGLQGRATNVLLRLDDAVDAAALQRQLQAVLPENEPYRVFTWRELLPEVAQFSKLVRHGLGLVLAILFLIVAVIVANTMLMSVFERRREFGTLMAIGAYARAVVRMVVGEAFFLGSAGVLIGAGLGAGAALLAAVRGLRLDARGSDAIPGVTDTVHPLLSSALTGAPAALLLVLVVLVSLYPAVRTVRMRLVEALRQD